MSTPLPLQILHLEDDPNDGLLVQTALAAGGVQANVQQVADEAGYRAVLAADPPDLILSDYALPNFDGLHAFALARELHPDLPFIFVSGTIGEDLASEAARSGANHYVLKSRLFRLPAVIKAALREADSLRARRRAERALHESERVTVQLMDIAPDPVLIQSEGRIRYTNAALRRLLGAGPEDALLGRIALDFIHADDRPGAETGLGRLLDMHQGLSPQHHRLQLLSGARVEVDINTVPTVYQGQASLLVIIRNISERQQREDQARQSQKMEAIGRLAGGIAHDFNNLLTVINGYAELLLNAHAEGDADLHPLQEIKTAGDRAAALTRQLLTFSRRQVINSRTLDLNESVRGIESMLRRLIGESVELTLALGETPARVRADAGQIEQVIMNLAVNARDAITGGGRITIGTAHSRALPRTLLNDAAPSQLGWSLLTVTDTGAGIDREVMRHLFEPFYTTKPQGAGTGLGLATVYAIVQEAGGQIDVESEPGRGTVMTVYFPAVDAAADAPTQSVPERARTGRHARATILLAEDEAALRHLAEKFLSDAGYKVLAAENGAAALRLLADSGGPVELLLTDVVMPGLSGPELASQARRLRPKLRVLYMSGYNDESLLRHGITDAGSGFVQKPFTAREVVEAIEGLLAQGNAGAGGAATKQNGVMK